MPCFQLVAALILILPLSSAFAAQPEDAMPQIRVLIAEAKPTSLKDAAAQLATAKLAPADQVALWSEWLEVVQVRITDIGATDELLLGFLDRLPRSGLPSDLQLNLARTWAANERRRTNRIDPGWPPFATKAGVALLRWCVTFEQAEDAKFDPTRKPSLNPEPPAGANVLPGSDPAAIADPVMRADYEKILADNAAYAEYYNRQTGLRRDTEQAANTISGWLRGVDAEVAKKLKLKAKEAKLSARLLGIIFPG